ncbi:GTP cyclohydrolase 1 [Candidatus Kuenenia stuttgartiensis]|uniref:GTP cyclohydrolase 1 n=1 Tax=Kuenenia stuttgartiensis TaxID=174633 RepID=Q1PYF3_KUEST|nr:MULTISPECIES: GTP cyclohydrolase I FolE [Kuenenia]MBW7943317.1 GTP cyclohydrolase I FolE [Candidatus Kuenenia stuttgartiensis]MCF6152900.1 GTP cyclohydrolase I FolE [Candidatus Kuenenia stuttgartiensis]MCZ7624330.1 GTP cyclohydrolase I FolE [Candidatus Kuenenia sp.]QII10527.1 GTP cyclohydrolase 1 [Candidatus Kuenenia stuttgartiensis]TVM01449.1 MAG: GTP cyclohydrolase I FolE [Candidatus Kuenenia stuttgartiensis]
MIDKEKIQAAIRLFIEGIGEDPNREGLQETPERVAEMCEEIFAGIGQDSHSVIKVLKSEKYDEIVLLKDIPFYSMCEHHLLPFSGVSHVAYIPQGNRVTGISKLARVVNIEARRPQVQERLTTDIAESIMKALKPKGVLVIIEAEHLCMTMRGIKKPGTKVLTSVVRGIFRDNPATRAEVMALIKGH